MDTSKATERKRRQRERQLTRIMEQPATAWTDADC